MVIFYKKWKKYNEFQLTKNKMDLNIRKMTNHPPSPEISEKKRNTTQEKENPSLNNFPKFLHINLPLSKNLILLRLKHRTSKLIRCLALRSRRVKLVVLLTYRMAFNQYANITLVAQLPRWLVCLLFSIKHDAMCMPTDYKT